MSDIPWFYVDDAFADSKPVMALDRSLRNEAIGLWVRCGAWSAKEETDGRVALDTVKSFDGTPRLIRALHEQAGLWTESSPESWRNSREILFGNWEKWQKTRAENVAQRKADAIRQANYRKAKKGRNYISDADLAKAIDETSHRDTDRNNPPDGDRSANSCHAVSHSAPTQTRPDPTLIPLVDLGGGVTQVAPTGPRPECHEHSENYDGPCRKCKLRRKWDEANAGVLAATELERKRAAKDLRENCPRCHGDNTYEDADGEVRKCDHQAVRHA